MARLAKALEEQLLESNPEFKARGLRPVVLWVPDPDRPGFEEELRQDFDAIRNSREEQEILDWMEQVGDWPRE